MFNIYQNERIKAQQLSKSQELLKKYNRETKHKKKYSRLKLKYDNRIKNFIDDMLVSPIKIDIPGAKESQSKRQSLLIKNIKNQRKNLKNSLNNSRIYDTTYTPLQMEFRTRDKAKEIQPSMFFKPRNQLQRVKDEVLTRSTYLDPNGDSIYPELHKKTHFKAVKSIMVNANGTKQLFRSQSLAVDSSGDSRCTITDYIVAKRVLQKCNYIPKKCIHNDV